MGKRPASELHAAVSSLPLTPLGGRPLVTSLDMLPALSLIPWFCDPAVQLIVALRPPDRRRLTIPEVDGVQRNVVAGEVLLDLPADQHSSSLAPLRRLVDALPPLPPGTAIELGAANLGDATAGQPPLRGRDG